MEELKGELIKKGAEAELYRIEWMGYPAVLKRRIPKAYRHPQLDYAIRRSRTIKEAQLLSEARRAGVPTPPVFSVNLKDTSIIMRYIEGPTLRSVFDELSESEKAKVCEHVGELVAKLHLAGIVHGDLTPANLIVVGDEIFFVDFGLAERSKSVEDRGVDLYLLKRALTSAHYRYAELSFSHVVVGYSSVVGEEEAKKVMERVGEIEKRGRYITFR